MSQIQKVKICKHMGPFNEVFSDNQSCEDGVYNIWCLRETVCQPADIDVMSDTLAVSVNVLREVGCDILPQHRQLRAYFVGINIACGCSTDDINT